MSRAFEWCGLPPDMWDALIRCMLRELVDYLIGHQAVAAPLVP